MREEQHTESENGPRSDDVAANSDWGKEECAVVCVRKHALALNVNVENPVVEEEDDIVLETPANPRGMTCVATRKPSTGTGNLDFVQELCRIPVHFKLIYSCMDYRSKPLPLPQLGCPRLQVPQML